MFILLDHVNSFPVHFPHFYVPVVLHIHLGTSNNNLRFVLSEPDTVFLAVVLDEVDRTLELDRVVRDEVDVVGHAGDADAEVSVGGKAQVGLGGAVEVTAQVEAEVGLLEDVKTRRDE